MAKAPTKKRNSVKQKTKGVSTTSPAVAKKPKFDKEAFVFSTPIDDIEKALERLEEQDLDPMAEPLTKDQTYWWANWLLNLPEAKKRGLTHVPTCAIENAVLGLYNKTNKRKKK